MAKKTNKVVKPNVDEYESKELIFEKYLKRCKEQENVSIDNIPVPQYIPAGFNTMKEIVAYSKTLKTIENSSTK